MINKFKIHIHILQRSVKVGSGTRKSLEEPNSNLFISNITYFLNLQKDFFADANKTGLYHTANREEFCDTQSASEKKWHAE